jgi:hypothetical protein
LFTAVTNWLFGKPRARLNYSCTKHGSSKTTWVLVADGMAHRRCTQCHLDASKKDNND